MTISLISNKQKKVVECARKIIGTQGMGNLTIHELAKALKVTDGAIYRHFQSKSEILQAIIRDIEETLFEALELAESKSENPVEKLKEVFIAHVSYAERRRGVTFLIINETLNLKDRRLQLQMNTVVQKYLKKIQSILSEGIGLKMFRKDLDTTSSSIAFFGIVQSLITIWALGDYDDQIIQKRMPKIFDLFLGGLIKK